MHFLRLTYNAIEHQYFSWTRQAAQRVLIGNHTWISPDDDYRDSGNDDGVSFRINVITRQHTPDFEELDERAQETARKWAVFGDIELLDAEEATLEDFFGGYTMRSRPIRDLARDLYAEDYSARKWAVFGDIELLDAEEATLEDFFGGYTMRSRPIRDLARDLYAEDYFTVRMERDFISELIVPSKGVGEVRKRVLPCYEAALTAELGRIADADTSRSHTMQGNVKPVIPAHYLIEGTSQSDYRPVVDVLVDSLCRTGRLPSRSVTVVDLDKMTGSKGQHASTSEFFCECLNGSFIQSLAGTSIVVKYGVLDRDGTFDLDTYRAFTRLIDAVGQCPDCAQAFFVIPGESDELKERVACRIDAPLLEIGRTRPAAPIAMDERTAMEALRGRAAADGLAPDDGLAECLRVHREKDPRLNIDSIYRDWSRIKRTHDAWPAYLPLIQQSIERKHAVSTSALQRLEGLIGLEGPKSRISEILMRTKMNQELRRLGMDAVEFSRHMAFTGAPGTGKTEVARLYAEVLREYKVLAEGRLISITGAQLAMSNVTKLFEKASGSVLFIDEAYALAGAYGTISELISCMENYRDETVVILAGYRSGIEELMECNPGFRSRIGFFVEFPNYSEDEKVRIFRLMAKRAGLMLTEKADSAVRDVIARAGTRDDEGNARFVRNLFESACGRQQLRLASNRPEGGWTKDMLATLEEEDIYGNLRPARSKSGRELLSEMVGLTEVKQLVGKRLDFMRIQKVRRDQGLPTEFIPMHFAFKGSPGTGKTEVARLVGRILREEGVLSVGDVYECGKQDTEFIPMHFAFKGSPGTGKTEVARLVGRILREEGVLSVGDVYECGKQDIVGRAVGETAPKIAELFKRAKGSVIFIDEAYALCQGCGNYEDEAVTAIIDQMEKLREEVVVIFAGYSDEIDQLLDKNPGFQSRIKAQIEFPDYSQRELTCILGLMAERAGISLSDGAWQRVKELIAAAYGQKNFGNARFVRNLLEDAIVAQGSRRAGISLSDGAWQRVKELIAAAYGQKNFGNARFVRNLLEDAIVAQGSRLVRECAERGEGPDELGQEALTVLEAVDFQVAPISAKPYARKVGFLS